MCKQLFYVLGMTDDQECSFSSEVSEVIRHGKVFPVENVIMKL